MEELFERHLRANHYKITPPRSQVFTVLQKFAPLTPKEVADGLSARVDRASTYRTISLFEKLGIIHHLVLGGRRVIELTDNFSRHHHHLTCTRCGAIQSVHDEHLEQQLHNMIDSYGFEARSHTIEVSGICHTCNTTR